MPVIDRECASCRTTLPPDAVFCHKCGLATPHAIDGTTGAVSTPETNDVAESDRRAHLQAALGDGYEVRRLLGRGGFAEVYVAFDKRLKREVAVKTIRGDLVVNETLLGRFQREAEAVAKLRHPNIVPIYAVGEGTADGESVAWFTMPLIEGESLAERLDRESDIGVVEAVRILREAAAALNAAHRAGLVHRDVKPENIMLEGPERSVIVMDFGIAKTEAAEAKGLTGTGMLVGTPHFMSPEQATGERDLDARSDQYALAMVGYRMITGRFPFEGDSVQTLIFKTVTEVPPPAADVNPAVPREVSDVLAKAMSKSPAGRYESMAAFGDALDAATRGSLQAPATTRRRQPDMATRVRACLGELPKLTSPWVIASILCFIAGLVLQPRATSVAERNVAAGREEAVFAARSFLRARGVTATGSATKALETSASTMTFLASVISPESLDVRASHDIPIWRWRVAVRMARSDEWRVDVGADSRVTGFEHSTPDTARAPAIPIDSARALARRELTDRGIQLAGLEALPDSAIARGKGDTKSRTDYVFRWRQRAGAVQWRGTDSAHVQDNVTVNGNGVTAYATTLHLPDAYKTATDTAGWVISVMVAAWALAVIMAGAAFALAITRQRVDTLQWRTMLRLVLGACAIGAIGLAPGAVESFLSESETATRVIAPLTIAVLGGLIVVAMLFVGVVAESLAQEERPSIVSGLAEWSRGKVMVPETIPAVAYGYIFGAVMFGVAALLAFVDRLRGGTVADVDMAGAFKLGTPTLNALVVFFTATYMVLAIMYAVVLLRRWKITRSAALVLPGVIYSGMVIVVVLEAGFLSVVQAGLSVLILSYVIWRHGVLAAIIAATFVSAVAASVNFALAGASLMPAVIVSAILLMIPAVLGVQAYRRYALVSPQPTSLT